MTTGPPSLAGLLPPGVQVSEAFGDVPGEAVFPGEEDLIAQAVQGRRREFVTTRRCAREALTGLGFAPAPLRAGDHREPLWPPGVVGALTHCAGYRAAAVAPDEVCAALGIDAEPHAPLPEGVERSIVAAGEPASLARLADTHPGTHWDRLLFSAKESVYKAWFPMTRRWLDFTGAHLTIEPAVGAFTADLSVRALRLDGTPAPARLHGRFLVSRGLIVTAVMVPYRAGSVTQCPRPWREAGRTRRVS